MTAFRALPTSALISTHVRAEPIHCALATRRWNLAGARRLGMRHALLLAEGRGDVQTDSETLAFSAPCLAWLPWRKQQDLNIAPGSTGHLLGVSGGLLVQAIGDHAESLNLRYLVDKTLIVNIEAYENMLPDIAASFAMAERELKVSDRGSLTVLAAHVSLILAFLWRLSGVEAVAKQSQGEVSSILQRFRHLVEVHFRDHRTVAAYAADLGISHDRLHDICRRVLGRTPLQLVHERVVHEARLRLERSTLTVEQVSHSLGFKDHTHFTQFFKRKTGFPPGKYRSLFLKSSNAAEVKGAPTYADWP